jgi:hypothetical protein
VYEAIHESVKRILPALAPAVLGTIIHMCFNVDDTNKFHLNSDLLVDTHFFINNLTLCAKVLVAVQERLMILKQM